MLAGIVSVTALWDDYKGMTDERAQDLMKETNRWNYNQVPLKRNGEDNQSVQIPTKKRGGFPPYRAGYGYFRGRRAAPDLQGQEFKWRTYHRIRPANMQIQSHHMSSAQKPEKKKSGFSPYRAGYGYFRGRRATV